MRLLSIDDIEIPLSDEGAASMLLAGLVYECDQHELHVESEIQWTVDEVEQFAKLLAYAIVREHRTVQ